MTILTPRQHDVAKLAAAGLTNKEIAAKLGISGKTVAVHLGEAFRKLGIARRWDLRECAL